LTRLERLSIFSNGISDISPLDNLKKLEEVYLCGNHISDVSPLSELHHLEKLIMRGNRVKDISPLSELNRLKVLNLCKDVEEAGGVLNEEYPLNDLSPALELENLEELSITLNQLDITEGSATREIIQELKEKNVDVEYELQELRLE